MGNCIRRNEYEVLDSKIERLITKSAKEMSQKTRILLLGTGESGKSTLFKQLKLIQNSKFSVEERRWFAKIIRDDVIESMMTLVMVCFENGYPLKNPDLAKEFINIKSPENANWGPALARKIEILWGEKSVKEAYAHAGKSYFVGDNKEHFFERVAAIAAPDYLPTSEDILKARVITTGIEEAEFEFEGNEFTLVDVGGQRGQRRTWIHSFDNVTSVLFVSSLISYRQRLWEDKRVNRLIEELNLFKEITSLEWFTTSNFILFLNKKDLFEAGLETEPLSKYFSSYNGENTYKDSLKFISKKFLQSCTLKPPHKAGPGDRVIYIYDTCAIDTNNIKRIFSSLSHTLFRKAVTASNLGF